MEGAPARPLYVLVVDDEVALRRLMAEVLLEELGAEVESAADGRGAIVALGARRPDLVLLDLRMHPVDGFAVLRWLQTRPVEARPPVVVLTGAGGAECAEAVALGAASCLAKPFELDDLVAEVRRRRP